MNFVLPDFTRTAWVSLDARETWGPRLSAISNAFGQREVYSVAEGVRSCCLVSMRPEAMIEQADTWMTLGLNFLPLKKLGLPRFGYSSTPASYKDGETFEFQVVVGKPQDLRDFRDAWRNGDHRAIGNALGYPMCCTEFFQEQWVTQSRVDTTWPMAIRSHTRTLATDLIEVGGEPEANILWRWVGVRAVPHLPCSFECSETVAFAKRFWSSGRVDDCEEYEWLMEVLAWPIEWSALHGIAEVRMPILKVITRTDATPSKYSVRKRGQKYPALGAKGVAFPYTEAAL